MPVAIITGASEGGARAGPRLSDAGWAWSSTPGGPRPARPADQLDGPVRAIPGDITTPATGPNWSPRRGAGRIWTCWSTSRRAGPSPAPPLSDFRWTGCARCTSERAGPAGADPAGLEDAAGPGPARSCLSRPTPPSNPYPGWGGYGSAKAALGRSARCWRWRRRRCGCGWSTRATCARRCTRMPFPARTSATGSYRRPLSRRT